MDNARSGLPEANAVLRSAGSEEVVDLLVEVDGTGKILFASGLGLNQVVAVDLKAQKNGSASARLRKATLIVRTLVGTAAVGRPAVMNWRRAI